MAERVQIPDFVPEGRPATADDPAEYLSPSWFCDSDDPAVVDFAAATVAGVAGEADRAAALFAAVRDEVRYNPYTFTLAPPAIRASAALASGGTWCVPKAVLLTAAARASGIPARVGFADVRNHLTTDKLNEYLDGADTFIWHGYTELHVGDSWVKATPAFDSGLCARFGVPPLEFDGKHEALLHAFDGAGSQFMEYLHDRGTWTDVPLRTILGAFREHYPQMADIIESGGMGRPQDTFTAQPQVP